VDRDTKRATILAAIAADGRYLKPLVAIPRDTCEAELFQIGFTPDKLLHASQENGFINTELFSGGLLKFSSRTSLRRGKD
jgi:hypothetical protein